MNTPTIVDPEVMGEARRLRSLGLGWHKIEQELGISEHVIRSRVDPNYRDFRNRQIREAAGRRVEGYTGLRHIAPEDALKALLRVPADTRSMTSKICGDPLPGRSALDRRNVNHTAPGEC